MGAEWLLTFAPIIGLGTTCLAHILCRKILRLRTGYALACGFLLGLVVMAVVAAANVPAAISTVDLAGLWATLGLTHVALAFGFWAFLNLNMTSLRIRMLRELLYSKHGMSRAELFGRYSAEEFLWRRLVRLERSGDLTLVDGCYGLGSQKLLYLDRCLKVLRFLLNAKPASARTILLNTIAIVSVLVFGAAVWALHQDRTGPFYVELQQFPAAISHYVYGTPRGLVDNGVLQYFLTSSLSLTAAQVVDQATRVLQTQVLSLVPDGSGVGGIAVVDLGFALFGPHASSLSLLFVLLIAISAGCFMLRYQDERMAAVPIVLLAYTLLLVTPITEPVNTPQAPIGGIRSYALIGILPALHWCFEFSNSRSFRLGTVVQAMLLAIQVAILGLSVFVRGSPIYLFVPVFTMAVIAMRKHAAWPKRRRILIWALIPTAVLGAALGVLPGVAFPDHAKVGRLVPVVWHRVFISLGAHPGWPFPGLRDKYSCPEIPGGIVASIVDNNASCVWFAYARTHGVSGPGSKFYDTDYERSLRAAVIDTVRSYPRQVIEAFAYYKPKLTIETVALTLSPKRFHATRPIAVLVLLQAALVAVFFGAQLSPTPMRDAARRSSILFLFLLPAFITQFLTWSLPWTAFDLFAYLWCGFIIICLMIIAYALRLVRTKASPTLRFDARSSARECD